MGTKKVRMAKIAGIILFNLICLFSIIYCVVGMVGRDQAISQETEVTVISEFEGVGRQPARTVSGTNVPAAAGESFLVDDFAGGGTKNRLGARANVYVMAPSKVMISRRDDVIQGKETKVLMIRYDKKNTGGPSGTGGWCGYYTTVKNQRTGAYLDGSAYRYITFWVKGQTGDENFNVGLSDEHWDKIGDSLKSEEIGVYLEGRGVTTEWQKAKVPLEEFFLDQAALAAITINFEASCFPNGAGKGLIFIDDIALEK